MEHTYLESEDAVEELGHVVVALVERERPGAVLALRYQAHAHQAVRDVLKEFQRISLRSYSISLFVPLKQIGNFKKMV